MQIRADFESGNLGRWEILGHDRIRVAPRADGSPHPLWFHFEVRDVRSPEIEVELLGADRCLGPRYGWNTARPVYRLLDDHCPGSLPVNGARAAGHGWRRTAAGRYVEARPGGVFRFPVPCQAGARKAATEAAGAGGVAIAYCYPYTVADLDAYRARTSRIPALVWNRAGTTPEGRGLYVATVGDGDSGSVWIVARQHAGESPASYAVEGMIDWLGGEGEAATARRAATFHLVPMADPDGVYHGRYGKNSTPVDFNRDWSASPRRPEIAALIDAIEQTSAEARPALLIDVHASHHGDTSCYLFAGEQDAGRQNDFLSNLEAAAPAAVGFRRADVRPDPSPAGSARRFFADRYGALVFCAELSYHLAQSGRYLTPDDYREFGRALARAAARCRPMR